MTAAIAVSEARIFWSSVAADIGEAQVKATGTTASLRQKTNLQAS